MVERSPLRPIQWNASAVARAGAEADQSTTQNQGRRSQSRTREGKEAKEAKKSTEAVPQRSLRTTQARSRSLRRSMLSGSVDSGVAANNAANNPGRKADEARQPENRSPLNRSSRLRTRPEAKPRDKVTPETERANSRQRSRKPQPSSVAPTPRTPTRLRTKVQAVPPLLRALRLLVVGVGLGAIVGTLISIWNPDGTQHARTEASHQSNPQATSQSGKVLTPLETQQELSNLKQQLQTLATAEPDLSPSVFVLDLDTKAYVDLAAATPFSAASTIKVPVLVAFLQDVDAGKIRLDELLEMRPDLIASEAGDMQYEAPGTEFTALEVADKMITVSDNTATNMLIDRLGGMAKLNERFASWGLATTAIRKPLPDLEGTNTTSARDLSTLMNLVNQGDLLSLRSRDRMLEIMRRTVTNTLLSPGLGEGAIIAHKTGDIGSVVGDVGLIDMPNGKQYLATALVKRPHNDQRANELIRQMSAAIYTYLNQSPGAKSSTASPTATPAATQDVQ